MGVKKYNLAEQLWVPCAVKRYTSREEMNTSVWEQTYKGNTIKKNGANVALSIDTSGGRGASVSTDQFYKDNCAIKLAANETYSIIVINNINVGAASVVVRYLDTNEIITSASYGELPESIALTPNVETDIYFGVDISVGASAVKETAMINVIRQSAWHDIDDFVRENGAWVTEAIVSGALPLTAVKTTGEDILNYKIYGASGGVGDRTENLFDKDAHDTANGYVAGHYINSSGAIVEDYKWDVTEYIPCIQQNVYCFSNCVGAAAAICWYDSNKNYISGSPVQSPTGFKTFLMSAPTNAFYIRTCVLLTRSGSGSQVYERNVEVFMITSGSTAPTSYIPYGYEVDMSVSDGTTSTTTPIYIGDDPLEAIGEYTDFVYHGVQKIIRKIIKIEFTGEEYWETYQTKHYIRALNYINSTWGTTAGFSRCSHFVPSLQIGEIGEYGLGGLTQYTWSRWNGNVLFNTGTSLADFKTYLATQKAAGTPVILWYVCEIPIEEDPPVPLPALPTFSNTDTIINYEDIPAPSSVEIKYKRRR